MTDPNELLDAVDRLTQPNRSKVIQDTHTVTLEMPPLLTQLEKAVAGTIGIGGSGSLASERNMLDSDALEKFLRIRQDIVNWAQDVQAEFHRDDPARTLRAWYVAWNARQHELDVERFHLRKCERWIVEIEAKLDPPRIRELPDRCPTCDAFEWFNPRDKHRYLHPLVVEYRPTGPDMIQEASGVCRACDTRWGVRQLAFDIEQAFQRDWDTAIEINQGVDNRTTTV